KPQHDLVSTLDQYFIAGRLHFAVLAHVDGVALEVRLGQFWSVRQRFGPCQFQNQAATVGICSDGMRTAVDEASVVSAKIRGAQREPDGNQRATGKKVDVEASRHQQSIP